jgi:tetratricopeptide (TPR) repeat protein
MRVVVNWILKSIGLCLILGTLLIFFILLFHEIKLISNEISTISKFSDDHHFAGYLNTILGSLGRLILIALISFILYWLSRDRGGVVVYPFDVASEKDRLISDLLMEELHRIRYIHELPRELNKENRDEINLRLATRNFPPLSSLQNNLGDALNNVGTIDLGKLQVYLGPLLLSIKKVWPFDGIEGIITGSIQTIDQSTHCIVQIQYYGQVCAWKVTQNKSTNNILSEEVIRELAYKVACKMIPRSQLPVRTRMGLCSAPSEKIKRRLLIFPYPHNGLGNIDFEKGKYNSALYHYDDATKEDPDFWKAYHNQGDIYLYKDDTYHYSCKDNYEKAVTLFNKGLELSKKPFRLML